MPTTKRTGRTERVRLMAAGLAVTLTVGGTAAAVTAPAWAGPQSRPTAKTSNAHPGSPSRPSLSRFDLNGYVIDVKYTLGRNKGSTFRQEYGEGTVRGSAIAGPWAGVQGSPQDYVALPIGHHELYVTWLAPDTRAISEALVLNFANRTVYNYAPGSDSPESAGTLTVAGRGAVPLP